jgi:hypothetical protein
MANRLQRRQGVVYGPVRPPDSGRGSGAILGRLLGAFVVVLAVGVLGAGALAFMNGNQQPSRSPSPTAFAQASASLPPLATASPGPISASPTPSPTAVASPSPTADPTQFAQIQIGPGFVTFGTQRNSQLRITDPQSTFSLSQRIRWSAHLTEPADSDDLRFHVAKLDPEAEGGERLIHDDEVQPDVDNVQIFARRFRASRYLEGAGVYVVRYLRGDEIMAEGSFLVEE